MRSILKTGYGSGIDGVPPSGGGGGDLGDGNVWRSSLTGVAGISAARLAAGSNLMPADVIITGFPAALEFFVAVPDSSSNLHILPIALPGSNSLESISNPFGFRNQLPYDGDWTNNSTGTGAWSVDSGTGLVTGTSVDSGNNEARATAGAKGSDKALLVIENLSAVASANSETEIILAVTTSDRYLSMRNTSGVWYMDASGGVTAQPIGTGNDIEILADGPANLIYWRFGRSGAWSSKAFANTFALTYTSRLRADRSGASTASISCDSAIVLDI